jgi:ABC-type amino acid transport substrate-binding protein
MAMAKGSPLRPRVDAFLTEAKAPGGAIGRLMDKWLPGARETLGPK